VAKKLLKLTTLLAIVLLVFMLTGCPKPPTEYALTITKTGNGNVTADPAPNASGKYTAGTEVTLTAVADAGWQFVKWVVGGTDVTDNPGVVTMDADKTVEAVFEEEQPVKYTLTITKTGEGTVVADPASADGKYEEGTEVELTATPAAGWKFVKWVVNGTDVTDNPGTLTMDADKAVEAIFEELGLAPKITNLSFTTDDFMVLQPCTENLEIRFQVKVDDPDSDLVEAEYSITHVVSGLSYSVMIPEDNWGAPWIYTISDTILKDNIGNPVPGGKYDVTVGATDAEGNFSSDTISFYVKYELSYIEDAGIVESEESQIKVVDGLCVVGDGEPGVVEATIFFDSKTTVRVYLVESTYTGTLDEMLTNGTMIAEEVFVADSAVLEEVEVELPDLKPLIDAGVTYKLLVLLFTPECGALGCVSCGIEDWEVLDCDFVEDTNPEIECLPCTCANPCDPCFVGYNPGILISNLLNTDPAKFDIILTINETVFTNEDFDFDADEDTLEVRVLIEEGMVTPELSGETALYWEVLTPTGVELDATCIVVIDFEKPEAEIAIENCCVNIEEVTETTFSVTFSDNIGLQRGKIWASGATIELPEGLTPGSWFALSGTESTVEGTVTLSGEEYTIYAAVEDDFCITSESSKTCGTNTAPLVDFGPFCFPGLCPPDCSSEFIELYWGIVDNEDNFTHFEIEVSHGALDFYDPEKMEGHVLWDLGEIDCEEVTATITAYDDCDGTTSSKTKSWTSPYPMDNVDPEIDLFFADCGEPEECATSAVLAWGASDACLDEIEICVDQGYLVYTDGTETSTYTCWGTDLATLTTGGTITWIFEDVDCENLVAEAAAWDTCGNYGSDVLVSENVIDNSAPSVLLGIVGLEFDDSITAEDIIGNTEEFNFDDFESDYPFIFDICDDATCLMLFWIVEENCLGDISLTTNYPLNPCGTEAMERPVGEYTYDPYHISLWDTFTEDGQQYTIGIIPFCLPLIDCDTFEATFTADDTSDCTGEVSDYAEIVIDNEMPELTLDWTLDEPTSCATEATLTWSITDGSFPCQGCDISACEIGQIKVSRQCEDFSESETIYITTNGTNVSYSPSVCGTATFDPVTNTFSGWIYYSDENVDCCDVEVGLLGYGCCCFEPNGLEAAELWLETSIDNVAPELEIDLPDLELVPLKFCEGESLTTQATVTIEATATDECFDEVVFEVSHGALPNGLTVWATTTEGFHSLIWDLSELEGIDCTDVTLTVTARDEYGCEETVESTSFTIDTKAPELEFYADPLEETCGATFVDLYYCIDDDCLTCGDCTTIAVAYIDLSSPMATGTYAGLTRIPITAECGCEVPLCGVLTWTLPEVDCGETLVATLTAWDTAGNVSSKPLVIGSVDNKPPVVSIFDFEYPDTITWDATDNCFDSISIWVSHGTLPDITVFPPANFEAAQYVPPSFSDQGITFTPAGTTTWDLSSLSESATVTMWLAAYDDCCNETVVSTSFLYPVE